MPRHTPNTTHYVRRRMEMGSLKLNMGEDDDGLKLNMEPMD